jgi:hypothetical protein
VNSGKWPHWTHFDDFALAMRRDGWTAKMQRNGSVFPSVGNLVELGRRKLSQINIVVRVASGTLVAALKARSRSSRFVILHRTPDFGRGENVAHLAIRRKDEHT